MAFNAVDFKKYRAALGFTNQGDARAFLGAKDIIADVDFSYLEKLNGRIVEIAGKLNALVSEEARHGDMETFNNDVINNAYSILRENNIIQRMNNLGRRPEETTFSWLRGYVILQFFLPAIRRIFSEKNIVTIGEDNLENIERFRKAPTADLEVNDRKRGQRIRLEVQSGFQGVNDVKQHKVHEAGRKFKEDGIYTIVVHFDIFNGQVAFVRIDTIADNDLRWITRQQMEGQTVFEIDQNSFLWLLQGSPPDISELERELRITI